MTAIRTGCDLTAVEDVTAGIQAHGERYLARVFTERERADAGDAPDRLAARFAGKEAVIKLLRPTRTDAIGPHDVAIVLDEHGAPTVVLSGAAEALAADLGITTVSVSLSHERGLAMATAVALSER